MMFLNCEFEIRSYKGSLTDTYTDEIVYFLPFGDEVAKVSVTLGHKLACVHNELLRDVLSESDVKYLQGKVPQMYQMQYDLCVNKRAALVRDIQHIDELIDECVCPEQESEGEQQESEQGEGEQE